MSDNSNQQPPPSIPPELSRKLVQVFAPPGQNAKRVPNDTALAVSKLLQQFILEARARASIEAECDKEGALLSSSSSSDDDDDKGDGNNKNNNKSKTEIRGEHITKTAANLLMDFS